MMPSEWTVLISAVVGGVIAAFATGLKDWINAWYERRKRRAYLATRLVCELEIFIDKCADVVTDPGDWRKISEGQIGKYAANEQPKFTPLDLDVDWLSVDSEIMHDTLHLPNKIRLTEERLENLWNEHADWPNNDDFFETREYEFAKLALSAQEILKRVRRSASIKEPKVQGWFEPQLFSEKVKDVEEKRNQRDADHRKKLRAFNPLQ